MEAKFMSEKNINIIMGKQIATSYVRKRDCYNQLKGFMQHEYPGKICALYGLRRTGKTVMMYQYISELSDKDKEKTVYILCLRECDMLELRQAMEDLYDKGVRNFFLDEITEVTDFQKYGNTFSDYFAAKGAKIVIAGTDSLGIMLAQSDILYDRIQMIHTSYIPFAEFSKLIENDSVDEYIEYGGTLTKSPYKTLQASEEYQNTAIVGNILHSLEKSEDARRYGAAITELYEQNELKSVLNKMINKFSYYTTVKAVNKCFKSAPLYSTIHNIQEPSYVSLINTEEANQATKNALGIKDLDEMQTSLSKRHLDELKNYLLELELFLEIPSYISLNSGERSENLEIFMQPGMIYAHSTALIKNLADDSMWKDTCGIADRNLFILRADHFVKGILLENIILAETYKTFQKIDPDRYYVSQLSITLRNNNQHVEADMILVDKQKGESYLFEVKYSNQIVIDQTKHLRNTDFLEYIDENFGKVKSRLVLYTGASSKQNDVLYLNAATYLKRLSIVSNTPRPEIKQLLNENCNTSKPNLKTTSRKKPRKL